MTTTENVAALLAAVYADPTDRALWLILADAYSEVDAVEEAFWRFAATVKHAPILGRFGGYWPAFPVSVYNLMPRRKDGDTIERCFQRLRIGWEAAGRPER